MKINFCLLATALVLFFLSGVAVFAQNVKPVLTYWGPSLDVPSATEWSNDLETFKKLRDFGFTHVGIHTPYSSDWSKYEARVQELRNLGFNLALHISPGRILTDPNELDPQTHIDNSQNLKYFDSAGFAVDNCATWVGNCAQSGLANDPAYAGVVWQKELALVDMAVRRADIKSNDLVFFDSETWGGNLGWRKWGYFYQNNPTGGAYPNLLNNSVGRYSGGGSNRETQFMVYWQARGNDLKNVVKRYSPNSLVLFYGENVADPNAQCPISGQAICPLNEITYMPVGTGDARSPTMYYLPNLQKFESDFSRGNFRGAYPWISFSTSEDNGFAAPLSWDSKITQKLGLRLRAQGAGGAIIYPGPYDHGVAVDYYLAHTKALADGFLHGLDPDAPPPSADTTPPIISMVAALSIGTSTATITWTTSKPATSQIDYGFDTTYSQSTALQASLVANHNQNLTGLSPRTLYHYRVRSKNAAGNEAVSIDFAFTTLPAIVPDTTASVLDATQVVTLKARVIELMKILIKLLQQKLNQLLILRHSR